MANFLKKLVGQVIARWLESSSQEDIQKILYTLEATAESYKWLPN